jgi:hypothetical protein
MTEFIRVSDNTNSTVADGLGMSADGNHVRQKRTGTRARPLVGADESSDEHGQSLMGTLATAKGHSKNATTARKAGSRQLSRAMDHEEAIGRFDSQ